MKSVYRLIVVALLVAGGLAWADFTPKDLKAKENKADYLVIAPREFIETFTPLAEHRRKNGLAVAVVAVEDVVARFGEKGQPDEDRIRTFIRFAHKEWSEPKLKYVVLVGDALPAKDGKYPPNTVPTFLRQPHYLNEIAATDNPYGCLGDNEIPDLFVGRLPADNAAELKTMIDKTIAYENDKRPGLWRRRMNFFAGEARFHPILDSIIEGVFVQFIARELPYTFDVTATYANPESPYCYVPTQFGDKVIERINEGALVLTYVGHGSPRSMDDFHIGDKRYPIFCEEDVPKVNVTRGNPVMIVIACSTGHFDNDKYDCIGEQVIKVANGPIAYIGASRISQPYSNAILGLEFIHAFFKKGENGGAPQIKCSTVGELFREVKRAIIEDGEKEIRKQVDQVREAIRILPADKALNQCKEELILYNLLGDPATEIGFIRNEVKLTLTGAGAEPGSTAPPAGQGAVEMKAGTSFQVLGECPVVKSGTAIVTLECDRKQIIYPVKKVKDPSDPKKAKRVKENYANANNKILVIQDGVTVEGGRFKVELTMPADAKPGAYYVKCYAASAEAEATGCLSITVPEIK
ncbi:MAG: C25 family cysteine peptidase [Planctomycetota bacterium]|nr:C25 family cysteine peptidase [Planctomycetota bacterium]